MWLKHTNPTERITLTASFGGYAVDAFDYMIYTMLIPTLMTVWSMSKAEAGLIATVTLWASALGGWAAGVLADRYGRVRVLQWTVLWFSFFTFLCGFTRTPEQLMLARALQGFGFGGEWSVGSVLIAETIRSHYRGRAVGLVQSSWAIGWGAAALAFAWIYSTVSPELAWRVLFWMGILPALLILYIRRNLTEPEVYVHAKRREQESSEKTSFLAIFSPAILKTTILASILIMGMQGGYYTITTWLPTFLKTERHLSVLGTGGYLLVIITGSFAGYLTSAWLSDHLGRKKCFMLFALMSLLIVTTYMQIPITDAQMMLLGFPLGFFVSGIFSGAGAFLSELFPHALRGSGQGFCYNFGRGTGSFFPALVGILSATMPLSKTIGMLAAAAYGLVIVTLFFLPETRGKALH
ncbi:MFS transporter [Pseudogulbenkiania sp. MAI-1]|uniref:MFS transporter n=1 Tax=Pseudogulbenkiania sp. MAI-1 TaxID=990370 RepID=UPI00045E65A1|nr:MFS transporter [Pseudogulbenkiania sp. MAI-1]